MLSRLGFSDRQIANRVRLLVLGLLTFAALC